MLSEALSRAVAFAALAAAMGTVGWLRVELTRHFDRTRQVLDVATIPRPAVARVLSLGHTEWITDVLWVNATIYYGETLFAHLPSRYVNRYAATMRDLDPHFRSAYLWGATALIYRVGTPSLTDVDDSITELRAGLREFPGDPEMTLQLGFNLAFEKVRFFADRPAEARALRAEAGEYLRRASLMGEGPPWLPLRAAAFLEEANRSGDAIDMLRDVLLRTTDPPLRERLEARLARLQQDYAPEDPTYLAVRQVERERLQYAPYLPASLYLFVGAPMVGPRAWAPNTMDTDRTQPP